MKSRRRVGLPDIINLEFKDELVSTIDKIKALQPELFKKSK